jgi:hypothetical protein
LPIEAEEASTLLETPRLRSLRESSRMKGLKLSWPERGTMRTFVGATVGGKERTYMYD